MTKYDEVIRLLAGSGVDFIIVGGAAATAHGSARLTEDLDIVYRRSRENVSRLVTALESVQPYLRDAPPGLPFRFDEHTIWRGLNFSLSTAVGSVDLFGEILGGGTYDNLLPDSNRIELFGAECLCLGLERLIHVKRAAGRPKDFEVIAELEAILELQKGETD
jgi:predicted nucleotidyltransferase